MRLLLPAIAAWLLVASTAHAQLDAGVPDAASNDATRDARSHDAARDARPVRDAGVSDADAAPPDATPATDDAATDLEPIPPPPNDDAAPWAMFDRAVELAAQGDRRGAMAVLDRILAEHPDHEAAPRASRLRERLSGSHADTTPAEETPADTLTPPDAPVSYGGPMPGATQQATDDELVPGAQRDTLPGSEDISPFARGELIAFQTLHGLAIGGELCVSIECEDEGAAAMVLTTTGGALALSFYLSRNGVRAGQALAANDGTLIGFFAGAMAMATSGADDETIGFGFALSQLLGLGVGLLVDDALRPTAGDVSLTFSGSIWATVGTALVLVAAEPDDDDVIAPVLLAAVSAGTITGALLSSKFPMSRARALILDGGGALGLLFSAGGYVLISDGDDEEGAALAGFVGIGIGIALAAALTGDYDGPEVPNASVALAPVEGGGIATVRGAF